MSSCVSAQTACDSDSQIFIQRQKSATLRNTITRTYVLTLSLCTHTHRATRPDYHLTFQGSLSRLSLPSWLSLHLPPHLLLRVLDLKPGSYTGWSLRGEGGREEATEGGRERGRESVKKHILSAESHLEVKR